MIIRERLPHQRPFLFITENLFYSPDFILNSIVKFRSATLIKLD